PPHWRRRDTRSIAGICPAMTGPTWTSRSASNRDGQEEHLLRHRRDDLALRVADHASQRSAATSVDEALHVLKQPLIGAGEPVEPCGVVQTDHAGGVTFQVQGPPADAGPVGGVAEQRRVQVWVVAESSRQAEPVT